MNVTTVAENWVQKRTYYHVACADCMVEQPSYQYEYRQAAQEAWNKRAGEGNDTSNQFRH